MELAFERILAAPEVTRGTAVDPPTYALNMRGKITPRISYYRPDDARGTLAQYGVTRATRTWCEWEMSGPLNVQNLPLWLAGALNGAVTPTTPPTATTARTWQFNPTLTSDNIITTTLYWGDPNVQMWQAKYCAVQSLEIVADAGGTDGLTAKISGIGHFPTAVTPVSTPSIADHPLIGADRAALWIDTSSAIGTTPITGRLISSTWSFDTGIVPKWLAGGGNLNYNLLGRGQRHASLKFKMEVPDTAQYALFAPDVNLKTRLAYDGDLIEAALRWQVTHDIYGPIDSIDWGEYEGTNRVLEATILSQYDVTATFDTRIQIRNTRTAI
jgi:hypothetical protein